ncbi:MAG TPA: thymidine phosphorylase [Candidatus Saccharimonadales bacterium]|nr:thymidine phosphorylase [Candidatus Saccharimonadales bacterium]
MLFVELIRKKRDGKELSREEIEFIVSGYTRSEIPDYQVSAFLMASLLRGLNRAETAALTNAMLHSGKVLDFSEIAGHKVDKHSTGGVGDKTSLILAPIVAAGGVNVPMVSGRGLGHTGGTLDKLEAIPGFNVHLELDEFRRILAKVGCAMIGQTEDLAPADKKLYALRDVTGTVESPNLICASIMSKKLAEGIDGLVLDVKTGSGAFMKNPQDSEFLADLMVETGERMGKKMVALITDMDQPLGRYIGNALEVVECVEILRGEFAGSEDLVELTLELCGWMFYLGGRTADKDKGRSLALEIIRSGRGLERFRELVSEQGGDVRIVDDLGLLPRAAHREDILSPSSGFVSAMECERMGIAGVILGGGRFKKEDTVDPAVGIVLHKKVGDPVSAGESLCTVHYNSAERFAEAMPVITAAYSIAGQKLEPRPLVQKVIQGKSV